MPLDLRTLREALILFNPHSSLDYLTEKSKKSACRPPERRYAELVYAGSWFSPLRESIDAFMRTATATCTGSVTVKLYKGTVSVVSRSSPYSLYREDIATFEEGNQVYRQEDAAGFIRL